MNSEGLKHTKKYENTITKAQDMKDPNYLTNIGERFMRHPYIKSTMHTSIFLIHSIGSCSPSISELFLMREINSNDFTLACIYQHLYATS